MRQMTTFKKIKATIPEPSTSLIGKALSMHVPGIGQVSILAGDNETAIAVFDKLSGEDFNKADINLAGIQDVAVFQSAVLIPST